MEIFFDEVSPHKQYFREMADINPVYKDKPEIGLPTDLDNKQMSQFQDIMERKRMKNLMEAMPKYKYLLETVCNLVRSFPNGESISPYHMDPERHTVAIPL